MALFYFAATGLIDPTRSFPLKCRIERCPSVFKTTVEIIYPEKDTSISYFESATRVMTPLAAGPNFIDWAYSLDDPLPSPDKAESASNTIYVRSYLHIAFSNPDTAKSNEQIVHGMLDPLIADKTMKSWRFMPGRAIGSPLIEAR